MNQPALFKPIVVHMVLKGHCPEKKNLWKPRKGGGFYIDKEVEAQILNLTRQAERQWPDDPVEHPDIQVRFFTRDRRPDRDNKFTTILDCLKAAEVIVDDNIMRCNGTLTIWPAEIDPNERVELVISYQWR